MKSVILLRLVAESLGTFFGHLYNQFTDNFPATIWARWVGGSKAYDGEER